MVVNKDGGGGISPHEIYLQLTTGPGAEKLHTAQAVTRGEAEKESERAQQIRALAEKIKAGWQGDAGFAAYGAAAPLADFAVYRADLLHRAQGDLETQSQAFQTARSGVRPIAAAPPLTSPVHEPDPTAVDTDQAVTQYQNDAQHNIAVFRAYDQASQANGAALPTDYPFPADPAGDLTITRAEHPTGSAGSGRTSSPVGRHQSGGTGGAAHPGTAGQVSPAQRTVTSGSAAVPPPAATAGPPPPVTGPPAGEPWQPGGLPVPGGDGGPGGNGPRWPVAAGGRGAGGEPGSGPGAGPGAGRGAGPRSDAGPRGAAGPGQGAGSRDGAGPRGAAGLRSGAVADEAAEVRRGASGRAVAGAGGVGAVPPGAGGRDEDEEHQRPSYLLAEDPEDVFGTDQVTAPPVIE